MLYIDITPVLRDIRDKKSTLYLVLDQSPPVPTSFPLVPEEWLYTVH